MTEHSLWNIEFTGSRGENEPSTAALLTVGNGRIGIRGDVKELSDRTSAGIFIAGFYDQLPRPALDPGKFNPFLISWSHMHLVKGYKREVSIVKCPDFLSGHFILDGEHVTGAECKILNLTRRLCLYTGEFFYQIRLRTPLGREIEIRQRRFTDMEHENRIYQKYTVKSINFTGKLVYLGYIDDETANFNISGIYQDTTDGNDHEYIRLYDTVRHEALSGNSVAVSIRGRVDGRNAAIASSFCPTAGCTVQRKAQYIRKPCISNEFDIREKESVSFERAVVFECSAFCENPYSFVKEELQIAKQLSYDAAREKSAAVFKKLWDASDMMIKGDDKAQLGIRHSIYHLLISACRSSSKVSVAAKGLTGEGYRGMVFWDTDIHMMPFYTYTQPDIARNIAAFRCNTLDGARKKARKYGQKGASYPWETGVSGNEECEDFLKLLTHQLHITSDVIYSIQKYLDASLDERFYFEKAAEAFIETARFWVSKGYEQDGKLHIPQASGPDELHLECDDSAYINNMAQFNLRLAARAIQALSKKQPAVWEWLSSKIGLCDSEILLIEKYKENVETMKNKDGLYEQCRGFFELEDRIVFEDSLYDIPADTQTVKQADVIMLLYLLPYLANNNELRANWDYYEPKTTHTSSLSYGVHGIVASWLDLNGKAVYYLNKSLGIDLYDNQNGSQDGVHLAANGMSWSAIVNGMAGVKIENGEIDISPRLPEAWESVAFTLIYRGSRLSFEINKKEVRIKALHSTRHTKIRICGSPYPLTEGEEICHCY